MSLCVRGRFQTRNRVCSWLAEKRAGSCNRLSVMDDEEDQKLRSRRWRPNN
jgi:hypothetical protein